MKAPEQVIALNMREIKLLLTALERMAGRSYSVEAERQQLRQKLQAEISVRETIGATS